MKPRKLTAQTVENAWKAGALGRYSDSGSVPGLFFEVTGVRAGSFWVRVQVKGKRSNMSLGPYPACGLADARDKAWAARKVAKIDKVDPVADRRAKESEALGATETDKTVYELIELFAEAKVKNGDWKPRTLATFRELMKLYLPARVGTMLQKHASPKLIWELILKPIWETKPAQASRVYKYLAMLYEYAEDCHDSPHSLRKLIRWMPKQPKGGHYKGLDWRELPALFKDLHRLQNTAAHNWRVNPERRAQIVKLNEFMSQKAIAATLGVAQSLVYHYLNSEDKAGKTEINYTRIKAFMLEFIFLTGALRVGSTVALKWKYVDEENKLLVIPRAEMKIDDEERGDFVIPLVPRAMEILEEMKAYKRGDYIFPGKGRRKPIEARRCARGTPYDPNAEGSGLVPTILWSFLKKDLGRDITVHGARRTIKNWCTTQQWVSDLTAELALDHKYEPPRRKYRDIAIEFTLGNVYGTKIENVYRDEQLIEERRKMLEALANYCLGQEEANVIQLQARVPRKTA